MAEEREETSRLYGPPKITVVPHEGLEDGPPLLHTSRVPGQVWDSQRVQQRWLFNAHPQAFVGSSEVSTFLAEGLSNLLRPDATPTSQPLLAISQMADVTNHTRVVPVPVLAMSAGESGELLRLSKIEETNWQWGENESPTLRTFSIDQHDREETVLWSSDGAPILQIKAALSLVRFEPTRWLLVQKRTSTTILQPEYHKVPVSERPSGIDKAMERPSRIDPKPILTITSEQTGGFAHSDVSFSYWSQKKPPQLAIIDECGYYSVWDIKGRNVVGCANMRPKLRHCGHIQLGVTEQLPDEDSPAFRTEPHGVLWIGSAGPGVDLWDVPTVEDPDTGNDLAALTARSKKLLLWNRAKFEVVDVKNPSFRKSLAILKSDEPDYILDVKSNPLSRSQVFILTSSGLFWIETSSPGTATAKTGSLAILQSFAHLRGSEADTLRLTVHHGGHGSGDEACALYLYSEKSPEVEVYWFSIPEKTGLPQFEHHMMSLNGSPSKLQTICPAPAFLNRTSSATPKGPGADYMSQHVEFRQLFVLGRDLSLSQSLIAISASPALEVVAPDNSREWSRDGRRQAHNKRRKQFLQHFEDTFVVPDGLGDMDELVQRRANRYQELMDIELEKGGQQIQQRWPRSQNFDLFMSRVTVSIKSVIMASEYAKTEGPLSVFDAIQEAAANCLETEGGYIPLHTLHEYETTFEAPPVTREAVAAWDSRFQELLGAQTERIIAQPITRQHLRRGETAAPLADIRDQLEELWSPASLPARAQQSRNVIIAETAEAIARSLFGVAILDANLPTAEGEPPTWSTTLAFANQAEPATQPTNLALTHKTRPSFQPATLLLAHQGRPLPITPYPLLLDPLPFPSSGPLSQSPAASPADTPPPPSTALQRLSMLAEDLNTTDPPARQHSVLSYWPTTRGVGTDGYVSSVLASSTKHMDIINERRQRAESRRRKRRSQLLGPSATAAASSQPYGTQDEWEDSGPATGPESLPPPATQPLPRMAPPVVESSQAPPVVPSSQVIFSSQVPQVMSQPVTGRHAMRSPGKKKKRKSGF
ncbi:hypothetical protein ColLi_05064 [Colletotrichum liriopes]|uniref:Uncharacterized protein n=1 Tax=Colletotrichum liriopes TaxID=708192 RepID=A0AA37LS46_9PEZI|nr:hypothetical protein ColLi_05064 [Colletotrichum liriopes]